MNGLPGLDFALPAALEAAEPPEARGLARDQVRLMVSYVASGRTTVPAVGTTVVHSQFRRLPEFLSPGDLLVINTSGTLNAALHARRANGDRLELHLSTHLARQRWSVELRLPAPKGSGPFLSAAAGESLELDGGASATLLSPYPVRRRAGSETLGTRLWLARLEFTLPFEAYLEQFGFPIRYPYVKEAWPAAYYQTVYATQPGSAEMPSAGRAFTPELITRLVAQGVQIAPLLLHTGVASLESHEPPYAERYRVPPETAERVNGAHAAGKRVVAVGTTVVRALETVTGADGVTLPGEGWTDLVVTPERGVLAVDGLLTGFHEPRSTHLAMLAALAGMEHLRLTYPQALAKGYLWHEFGDLHLIMRR
jgi:S-adenosylmethionine:tRNA ribosyltransferase-isomerase